MKTRRSLRQYSHLVLQRLVSHLFLHWRRWWWWRNKLCASVSRWTEMPAKFGCLFTYRATYIQCQSPKLANEHFGSQSWTLASHRYAQQRWKLKEAEEDKQNWNWNSLSKAWFRLSSCSVTGTLSLLATIMNWHAWLFRWPMHTNCGWLVLKDPSLVLQREDSSERGALAKCVEVYRWFSRCSLNI